MIRPLHRQAQTAFSIKKGDEIVPVQYSPDRTPTDKVEFAAFDTLTIISKKIFHGVVEVYDGFHQVKTMTFQELGLPRFTIPLLKWGRWSRQVCTVPNAVALDMMRDYVNTNRSTLNRGPGPGPFDAAAISKNRIGLSETSVFTAWDRDKIAS